jgi:hypothetical protein
VQLAALFKQLQLFKRQIQPSQGLRDLPVEGQLQLVKLRKRLLDQGPLSQSQEALLMGKMGLELEFSKT